MTMDRYILKKEQAALIVVDVQDRLAAVMSERQKVTANILHLIEAAKLLGLPVVLTEQYPKGLGPTVNEIKEALPASEPIEKLTFRLLRRAALPDQGRSPGEKEGDPLRNGDACLRAPDLCRASQGGI